MRPWKRNEENLGRNDGAQWGSQIEGKKRGEGRSNRIGKVIKEGAEHALYQYIAQRPEESGLGERSLDCIQVR